MRRLIAVVIAGILALSVSGVALGITLGANPSFQAHNHGVKSSWSLSWGTQGPFTVLFVYDNTNSNWNWQISNTNTTSKNLSTAFYPCSTTVFQQRMLVADGQQNAATIYTRAQEGGGSPC